MRLMLAVMIAVLAVVLLTGCPSPIDQPPDTTNTPTPDNQPEGTPVTLLAIPDVAAPVAGASPVTSLETSQYTGTISWSPMDGETFEAVTVYTATISLTARDGYTFTGVPADSFTVAGAVRVTYDADSGTVSAVFPNLSLIAIRGGTFNNGSADMTVSNFRIGRYEITGKQYAAVMDLPDPSVVSGAPDSPVEYVNWYAALVFCNRLSMAEGLTPVYAIGGSTDPAAWGSIPTGFDATWFAAVADWSADGYRLPTEAEWEFAARGGNAYRGFTYAGSNDIDAVAWYSLNSGGKTHAVGTKQSNELGLYDMTGNVYEWCWDRQGNYPATAQTDYRGTEAATNIRTFRGGSANYSGGADNASSSTVSSRSGATESIRSGMLGFRVARQ